MSYSRIAILLLVCAIALPTGLFQPAPGRDAGRAPALAASLESAVDAADTGSPLFKKADKKEADNNRKHDARDRKIRHERDRRPPQRKRDRHRDQGPAHVAPTRRALTEQLAETCDGPGMIFLPQSGLCTHGPDPAPPGIDPTARANPVPAARASRVAAAAVCDGDGRNGPRVQVLYAHASDRPNRFATYLASFRTWTAETDAIMRESAATAGGNLRFRFVTEPGPGCAIDVQQVTLSPTGDDAFDNTIVELKAQGFTRTDRYYLIFVDTASAGICGIATGSNDDSPEQANWNNYGPGFARVDATCWNAHTAAHELMHNLGAVNASAPNTTGFGHCIDDYDVMCYPDEPFYPAMRIDCPDESLEDRYDCGSDDYFNPNPNPGSYLETHWNTANNRFLVGGGNGPDDDGEPPVVTWVSPAGNDSVHEAAAGTLTLEATASDGSGINRIDFWRYDRATETSVRVATDRTAPYALDVAVTDLYPGNNYYSAFAIDGIRAYSGETVTIKRTEPNPEPPTVSWISPVGNGETHSVSRGTVSLEVEATDTSGIGVVQFWRFDEVGEAWVKLVEDDTASYGASLPVADLSLGENTVIADGYDIYDNRSTEYVLIDRIEPPPAVAITSPQDGAKVKARATVGVAVEVAEPAGASVEVRSCPSGSCSWAAGTSLGFDTSAPFGLSWTAPASGAVTFLAQVSGGDGPARSEPVTVSVEEAKAKKKKKKKKKKR